MLLRALTCLLVIQLLALSEGQLEQYISRSRGIDNPECGSFLSPCATVNYALNLTFTLASNIQQSSTLCYTSGEDVSLHINLLEGDHVINPVCFTNVYNFSITGMGAVSGIRSSVLGNTEGILAFFDSYNVRINNITFVDSVVGRSSIYAKNTTELYIDNCDIPIYANGAYSVWLNDPYGNTFIRNVKFYSIPALVVYEGLTPASALLITIGKRFDNTGLLYETNTNLTPSDIKIHNSIFENIVSNDETSPNFLQDYRRTSDQSKVVQIFLRSNTIGNIITFVDCIFQENKNNIGSTVVTRFSDMSAMNSIEFRNCIFQSNLARFGAGIAVYLLSNAEYNNITITNCTFVNNEAILEGGGVFMVTFVPNPQSNLLHIKDCVFYDNTAFYGASVFLFNNPSLYQTSDEFLSPSSRMVVRITDTQLRNNTALLSEGIINTLRIQLELNGDNVLTGNTGSSIVLRSSTILIRDEIVFSYNKAENGGALKILDRSRVDMNDLINGSFIFNQALFSGGAIYADESSTTITADQYNHTSDITVGSCFIRFPSIHENPDAMLYLSGNTAVTSGNDFAIYCVRTCFLSNFLPDLFDRYVLPNPFSHPVVIETDNPLAVTSTGPTYMFFYGASTKCYKPIGDLIYFLPNCSNELLMHNFLSLSELACGVDNIIKDIRTNYVLGRTMFHPLVDQLILPWADISHSWTLEPSLIRQTCLEPNPGSLTLSPAPGEKFDLTVQLADQLLNYITATIFLEIDHQPGVSSGALIQLNGIQWAYNDRVYFTPNRALSDLAIVGLPGTKGIINVVSVSQILGLNIILQIPFQLSQCPLGYYDPPIMSSNEEVDDLILRNYSNSQRIPADQPLACQCFIDSNVQFSEMVEKYDNYCIGGYTVNLNGILWAGLIPNATESVEMPTTSCYSSAGNETVQSDSLSVLIENARAQQLRILGISQDPDDNPIDVIPYQGTVTPGGGAPVKCYSNSTIEELINFKVNAEFSVDLCTRGFCEGNTETNWYLSDVNYPCTDTRHGVLCGQCKDGLSLTLTTTKCQDCSNPMWYIPLITTTIIGLLLVISVVSFNIGISPTLDSFLFFIQAVYIILSGRLDYQDFQILSFFNLDFTFNQCIIDDLQALPRLLLQYITPLYILTLLGIILLLTKIKGFSKYFGEHSLLNALWLLILVSYLNISNSTFEILNCQKIGPTNKGFQETVLVYDASVICWTGLHLPFAIIAVLLAIFVIVPFPVYAALAVKIPKLKPITDVYCGLYRDNQRYWIIWNIFKRVLIVMFSVFITDFIVRHFFLLLTSIGILVVSIATWPYRYWIDNAVSISVSTALLLFCVVTQPELYVLVDPSRIISWMIVAVVSFFCLVMIVIEISFWYVKRKGFDYTKEILTPLSAKTKVTNLVAVTKKRITNNNFTELEESVHSNEYYERANSTNGYREYREPLIDSNHFSFVRVSDSSRITNNKGVPSHERRSVAEPIGINSSHAISKSIVTHSTVTRDEGNEKT